MSDIKKPDYYGGLLSFTSPPLALLVLTLSLSARAAVEWRDDNLLVSIVLIKYN